MLNAPAKFAVGQAFCRRQCRDAFKNEVGQQRVQFLVDYYLRRVNPNHNLSNRDRFRQWGSITMFKPYDRDKIPEGMNRAIHHVNEQRLRNSLVPS